MMNNNIQQLFQAVQNGVNPNAIVMQLAQGNPVFQRALQMTNGKTPEQIYAMAQQMAQQRGVNINQLAQQLGIIIPK